IRAIYLHNLSSLFHACLVRGDLDRARRAWSILVQCREVDWKTRSYWGLEVLQAVPSIPIRQSQFTDDNREAERWLRTLQLSAKDHDKPQLLLALVLHLIKHDRHRQALDELELYLPSPPYDDVSTLHTYAGMLSFYLAQP
ncbi:hypothetical protein TREMEDRAFT_17734, partial [Tremella mesenterica DSM 1558]